MPAATTLLPGGSGVFQRVCSRASRGSSGWLYYTSQKRLNMV